MRIFSFIFTWTCTKNIDEYESLFLGLSKVVSMCIRCLIVHGDSELVINQVKDKINARHHYLKTYKNRVWDVLESCITINLISIIGKYNQIIDVIARK